MEVDESTIRHLAELSDFAIDAEQTETLTRNLKDIIGYISELDGLDTEGVEPTYQVFEMENVWREDVVKPQDASREELLSLTREEKDNQIKVPRVL